MADDEECFTRSATNCIGTRASAIATYARAVAKFGEQGVIDIVGISGYYTHAGDGAQHRAHAGSRRAHAGPRAIPALKASLCCRVVPSRIGTSSTRRLFELAASLARAAAAVCRQRLRCTHLRSRLVPAARTRHRVVGGVDGRAARHVHGRHVSRQPAAAALHSVRRASAPRLRRGSNSASASSGCCCCSACRSSAAPTPPGPAPASSGILLRGVAAGICLLPPTLLMGATLPAIARWVERTPDGVAWLGFFYGGNTAGAVIGSLLAGFYLLSCLRHLGRDLCRRRAERRGRAARRWLIAARAPLRAAPSRRCAGARRDRAAAAWSTSSSDCQG